MNCGVCNHREVCRCFPNPEEYCSDYEPERPQGEWEHWGSPFSDDSIANSIVCSLCKARYVEIEDEVFNFCPNCGASMSANDRQVTGKLNSDTEYKAKVKELEDAIAKCERAEKEFKSRTCKFRSQINCDFCAFHSECEEHWKEGEENDS